MLDPSLCSHKCKFLHDTRVEQDHVAMFPEKTLNFLMKSILIL